MSHRFAILGLTALTLVLLPASAGAAELKVMGAGPVEATFKELVAAFTRETGHKVEGTFNTVGYIQDKLRDGEKADILILTTTVMEDLEKAGALAAGSRVEIGRTMSGFAVQAGAPAPDISTPDALKKTLLAARTVAYVHPAGGGTTGIYFARLLERLGIAEPVNMKAIKPPRGAQVAEAIAEGYAEIGNTNLTELIPHKGVKVIGPIPDPYGLVVVYAAGVAANSASKEAAKALIAHLTTAAARDKFKAAGL